MPILFPKAETHSSINSLIQILTGKKQSLESMPVHFNRLGSAIGTAVGGNLSLIVDSLGTASEIDTINKILLIEEVDEYLYKIDRMMVQLKRAGKLSDLAGLIVGYMTDIKDTELPFGETVENIILNHTKEFNYPIAFGFSFGHQNPNVAWIQGRSAELFFSNETVTLQYL
jgi:muramoyltetrapeptide carboxypeptidase